MFILDKPYVSQLLERTLIDHQIPVLIREPALIRSDLSRLNHLDLPLFFERLNQKSDPLLYTNSENAVSLIYDHAPDSRLAKVTRQLKDKAFFREKTQALYPGLQYMRVTRSELSRLQEKDLTFPLILKPAVGFFSMGVYRVDHYDEWSATLQDLEAELTRVSSLYPQHVLDTEGFLIESYIEGREYAVDAYYDDAGEPVILNILEHLFASERDTGDRCYYTGGKVIEQLHRLFTDELRKIGSLFDLRRYPVHVEFRVQSDSQEKRAFPIEVNPLRFAGWCSTDLAYYAYGINPYQYFFQQQKPDWAQIIQEKGDRYFGITVAEIPPHIDREQIDHIDYGHFEQMFSHILDIRKIDYRMYPVFAFVFSETKEMSELKRLLHLDLTEFIHLSKSAFPL